MLNHSSILESSIGHPKTSVCDLMHTRLIKYNHEQLTAKYWQVKISKLLPLKLDFCVKPDDGLPMLFHICRRTAKQKGR